MTRSTAIILLCAALFVVDAVSAHAASTRAEYIAQVDPICRTAEKKRIRDVEGDDALLAGARKLNGLLKKVTGPMIRGISQVQPAPGDEAIVFRWVSHLKGFQRFGTQGVRAAFHGKRERAKALFKQTLTEGIRAGDVIEDFGFQYC